MSMSTFQVLRAVKRAIPTETLGVRRMVMDFEKGMWSAVRSVFPDVTLQGCLFHWTQAVWRKVQIWVSRYGQTKL